MIDIVTVVFREELATLKLQAQSINLYAPDLGRIYVVINDESMDVDEIDLSWWGQYHDRVTVVHRRVWGIDFVENGWLTQQLLKLLATDLCSNKWSMILDAKTILVQTVSTDRLFKNNKLTWGYFPIFPVFEPARLIVSKLFDIEQRDIAGPAGIPFFFENSTVRDMIKEVESRTQKTFADWFQQTGMVTEFILYSGYLEYRYGSLDAMYVNTKDAYQPCNICHTEAEIFDRKFQQMQEPNVLTVSIHRNAWNKLTAVQQQTYQDFLTTKGIK